ncbi:MAG: hypothetical protein STSR0004_18500 [Peptococcaceae bacterium]
MVLVFFLVLLLLVFAGLSLKEEKQEKLTVKKENGKEITKVTQEKSATIPGEAPVKTPEGSAGAPPKATAGRSFSSRQEIEAYFSTRLNIICRYYEGRLNGLLGLAWNEYQAAQKQKERISTVSLAPKYISAGNALERECDQEFYAVLSDFKAELRKNSFPLDKAFEAQREYKKAKAARKKQIFHTAAKLLLPP